MIVILSSIVGHTGSGKSTLIQHLNGLLKPNRGDVLVDGLNINQKEAKGKLKTRRTLQVNLPMVQYNHPLCIARNIIHTVRNHHDSHPFSMQRCDFCSE